MSWSCGSIVTVGTVSSIFRRKTLLVESHAGSMHPDETGSSHGSLCQLEVLCA